MIRKAMILLTSILMAGCVSSPALVSQGGASTSFLLVTDATSHSGLFSNGLSGLNPSGYDSEKETAVGNLCDASKAAPLAGGIGGTIFSLILEPAIKKFVETLKIT